MTAGLGQIEVDQPAFATAAPTALPSTFGERAVAGFEAAFTEDRYGNMTRALKERTASVIQDYYNVTGEKLANPADLQPTQAEIRENLGSSIPAIMAKRMDKLKAATSALRGQIGDLGGLPPGFLDVDYVPVQIAQAGREARERAARLEGTGGGAGAFLGAMAGGIAASPFDVLGLGFLGATAVPREAARATLAQWAGNVAREGGFQALVQSTLAVPGIAADVGTRKPLGTAPSATEIAEELGLVAGGGFLLGAGVRAVHGALTKLRLAGVDLPPDVKDAAVAVEHDALYGDKNAIGAPAGNFEKMVDGATADVLAGRPPTGPYDLAPVNERGVPIGPRSIFEEPLPNLQMGGPMREHTTPDVVRVYHGGGIDPAGLDELHVTTSLADAEGWAARGEGMHVWFKDVPVDSPWLRKVQEDAPDLATRHVVPKEDLAGFRPFVSRETISPELRAEAKQVSRMIDQPLPQAPTVPEKQGAGRPVEPGLTPEDEAVVTAAKARAEQMQGGSEFLRRMEALDEHETGIRALASHCKIKVP